MWYTWKNFWRLDRLATRNYKSYTRPYLTHCSRNHRNLQKKQKQLDKMSKLSFPSTQYHAKHQNMSQFGKTPRHVIANDHVPNKWASRIDDVTAWWNVMTVADNTEAKSVSIPAVSVLYPSNRSKRTIGGDTRSSRRAWRKRRVLQTQKIRLRCRAIMY